ncbi:MAG: asparaginase [Bacteroidetes bacterium]|nr:MAG: asparaginase [Bacteroidota bacterium]
MMENPILVDIYRGGVLESFHRGVVCIVDENNQVLFSLGNINQVCYPRSAMKLLQVLPLIQHGGIQKFGFTLEEIAVMCGSHNAEAEHLRVVASILHKIGLTAEYLNCGPQYPSGKKEANALIKADAKPQHIHNNCSGKHAGMLAMCVLKGWPVEDYINPRHPLQQLIMDLCARFFEYPKEQMVTALDGCSAPIFSVPVINQAIAYKNLSAPAAFEPALQEACKVVIEAVSQYPFMVAGTKRYCTDMMNITAPAIIGKTGAEGIFCMSFTQQKWGVCIKIDDGKMLPQYNIAQAIVEAVGLFSAEQLQPLQHYQTSELKNFNQLVTGEIKVNNNLLEALKVMATDNKLV